jgi:alpha-beta hydrolase superfamily lysophospholipase
VQNPTTWFADDPAFTRRAIAAQDGPVVLVGHSCGGGVVTEAGTDAKGASVVYIAAFAPDIGGSVERLIANPPAGAPNPAAG